MGVINKVFYFCLLNFLVISVSWGQDQALQKLNQGKNYFWEAKFDSAMVSLTEVINMTSVSRNNLFEAYLYLGFVLARQYAPKNEIRSAFEQAIKLDPKRKIDELVIPPDLAEMFNQVRNQLVGCIYVTSKPLGAEVLGLQEENIVFIETTPTVLCGIINREYQILFTKYGFEEKIMTVHYKPGIIDSLFVTLIPRMVQKSQGTKWWPWVTGGGALATAAAILFKTVFVKGNTQIEDLPKPPARPPR